MKKIQSICKFTRKENKGRFILKIVWVSSVRSLISNGHGPFLLSSSSQQKQVHLLGGQQRKGQVTGEKLDWTAIYLKYGFDCWDSMDLQYPIPGLHTATSVGWPIPDHGTNVNALLLLLGWLHCFCGIFYSLGLLFNWPIADWEAKTLGEWTTV